VNCPDCQRGSRVVKTVSMGGVTFRERLCECGVKFHTQESLVATGNHGQPPVAARNGPQPPATPPHSGGVGGGLPSGSGPDQNPILPGDPERARARSKYPSAFEEVWAATDQTGSKHRALAAWKRQGQPPAEAVAAFWARWKATDQWRRGIVPHVSTWLNGRCFEQEPREVPRAVPAAAPDARCLFHRLNGTRGKVSRAPRADCPECKHAAAAARGREGEPTPAVAIVPATADQLAGLRRERRISIVEAGADGTEHPVEAARG
jgi:hypothetical protein